MTWFGLVRLFSQTDLPPVFLNILVTITVMLMIGKHDHPTIHELVLEPGLVLSTRVMSFSFESITGGTVTNTHSNYIIKR
jgi:hypothetical protein